MSHFLDFLHTVPLFFIIAILLAPYVYKFITQRFMQVKFAEPLLLLLCSIGIAAGSNIHGHHMMHFIDPCFGYAAVIIGVAAKLLAKEVKEKTKVINA